MRGWDGKCIVVWKSARGGFRLHLPGIPGRCGWSDGYSPACSPDESAQVTFTFRFSRGMRKCRRCFTKTGRPRIKFRPKEGWHRYEAAATPAPGVER